jgi:hypothetical protein
MPWVVRGSEVVWENAEQPQAVIAGGAPGPAHGISSASTIPNVPSFPQFPSMAGLPEMQWEMPQPEPEVQPPPQPVKTWTAPVQPVPPLQLLGDSAGYDRSGRTALLREWELADDVRRGLFRERWEGWSPDQRRDYTKKVATMVGQGKPVDILLEPDDATPADGAFRDMSVALSDAVTMDEDEAKETLEWLSYKRERPPAIEADFTSPLMAESEQVAKAYQRMEEAVGKPDKQIFTGGAKGVVHPRTFVPLAKAYEAFAKEAAKKWVGSPWVGEGHVGEQTGFWGKALGLSEAQDQPRRMEQSTEPYAWDRGVSLHAWKDVPPGQVPVEVRSYFPFKDAQDGGRMKGLDPVQLCGKSQCNRVQSAFMAMLPESLKRSFPNPGYRVIPVQRLVARPIGEQDRLGNQEIDPANVELSLLAEEVLKGRLPSVTVAPDLQYDFTVYDQNEKSSAVYQLMHNPKVRAQLRAWGERDDMSFADAEWEAKLFLSELAKEGTLAEVAGAIETTGADGAPQTTEGKLQVSVMDPSEWRMPVTRAANLGAWARKVKEASNEQLREWKYVALRRQDYASAASLNRELDRRKEEVYEENTSLGERVLRDSMELASSFVALPMQAAATFGETLALVGANVASGRLTGARGGESAAVNRMIAEWGGNVQENLTGPFAEYMAGTPTRVINLFSGLLGKPADKAMWNEQKKHPVLAAFDLLVFNLAKPTLGVARGLPAGVKVRSLGEWGRSVTWDGNAAKSAFVAGWKAGVTGVLGEVGAVAAEAGRRKLGQVMDARAERILVDNAANKARDVAKYYHLQDETLVPPDLKRLADDIIEAFDTAKTTAQKKALLEQFETRVRVLDDTVQREWAVLKDAMEKGEKSTDLTGDTTAETLAKRQEAVGKLNRDFDAAMSDAVAKTLFNGTKIGRTISSWLMSPSNAKQALPVLSRLRAVLDKATSKEYRNLAAKANDGLNRLMTRTDIPEQEAFTLFVTALEGEGDIGKAILSTYNIEALPPEVAQWSKQIQRGEMKQAIMAPREAEYAAAFEEYRASVKAREEAIRSHKEQLENLKLERDVEVGQWRTQIGSKALSKEAREALADLRKQHQKELTQAFGRVWTKERRQAAAPLLAEEQRLEKAYKADAKAAVQEEIATVNQRYQEAVKQAKESFVVPEVKAPPADIEPVGEFNVPRSLDVMIRAEAEMTGEPLGTVAFRTIRNRVRDYLRQYETTAPKGTNLDALSGGIAWDWLMDAGKFYDEATGVYRVPARANRMGEVSEFAGMVQSFLNSPVVRELSEATRDALLYELFPRIAIETTIKAPEASASVFVRGATGDVRKVAVSEVLDSLGETFVDFRDYQHRFVADMIDAGMMTPKVAVEYAAEHFPHKPKYKTIGDIATILRDLEKKNWDAVPDWARATGDKQLNASVMRALLEGGELADTLPGYQAALRQAHLQDLRKRILDNTKESLEDMGTGKKNKPLPYEAQLQAVLPEDVIQQLRSRVFFKHQDWTGKTPAEGMILRDIYNALFDVDPVRKVGEMEQLRMAARVVKTLDAESRVAGQTIRAVAAGDELTGVTAEYAARYGVDVEQWNMGQRTHRVQRHNALRSLVEQADSIHTATALSRLSAEQTATVATMLNRYMVPLDNRLEGFSKHILTDTTGAGRTYMANPIVDAALRDYGALSQMDAFAAKSGEGKVAAAGKKFLKFLDVRGEGVREGAVEAYLRNAKMNLTQFSPDTIMRDAIVNRAFAAPMNGVGMMSNAYPVASRLLGMDTVISREMNAGGFSTARFRGDLPVEYRAKGDLGIPVVAHAIKESVKGSIRELRSSKSIGAKGLDALRELRNATYTPGESNLGKVLMNQRGVADMQPRMALYVHRLAEWAVKQTEFVDRLNKQFGIQLSTKTPEAFLGSLDGVLGKQAQAVRGVKDRVARQYAAGTRADMVLGELVNRWEVTEKGSTRAVKEAGDVFVNSSDRSKLLDTLAGNVLAPLFLTYTFKMTPQALKWMAQRPVRVMAQWALMQATNQALWEGWKREDQEDWMHAKRYAGLNPVAMVLPPTVWEAFGMDLGDRPVAGWSTLNSMQPLGMSNGGYNVWEQSPVLNIVGSLSQYVGNKDSVVRRYTNMNDTPYGYAGALGGNPAGSLRIPKGIAGAEGAALLAWSLLGDYSTPWVPWPAGRLSQGMPEDDRSALARMVGTVNVRPGVRGIMRAISEAWGKNKIAAEMRQSLPPVVYDVLRSLAVNHYAAGELGFQLRTYRGAIKEKETRGLLPKQLLGAPMSAHQDAIEMSFGKGGALVRRMLEDVKERAGGSYNPDPQQARRNERVMEACASFLDVFDSSDPNAKLNEVFTDLATVPGLKEDFFAIMAGKPPHTSDNERLKILRTTKFLTVARSMMVRLMNVAEEMQVEEFLTNQELQGKGFSTSLENIDAAQVEAAIHWAKENMPDVVEAGVRAVWEGGVVDPAEMLEPFASRLGLDLNAVVPIEEARNPTTAGRFFGAMPEGMLNAPQRNPVVPGRTQQSVNRAHGALRNTVGTRIDTPADWLQNQRRTQ